jgi:glycerol-3-phosphate acyltransferase PlsY
MNCSCYDDFATESSAVASGVISALPYTVLKCFCNIHYVHMFYTKAYATYSYVTLLAFLNIQPYIYPYCSWIIKLPVFILPSVLFATIWGVHLYSKVFVYIAIVSQQEISRTKSSTEPNTTFAWPAATREVLTSIINYLQCIQQHASILIELFFSFWTDGKENC